MSPHPEPLYTCNRCDALRTKAEGGATFTVCDECWEKHYRQRSPPMNKHERAVRQVRWLARSHIPWLDDQDCEDLRHALKVLEAVEGVEEWMVRFLGEEAAFARYQGSMQWAEQPARIRTALQAILDAKGDPDG